MSRYSLLKAMLTHLTARWVAEIPFLAPEDVPTVAAIRACRADQMREPDFNAADHA